MVEASFFSFLQLVRQHFDKKRNKLQIRLTKDMHAARSRIRTSKSSNCSRTSSHNDFPADRAYVDKWSITESHQWQWYQDRSLPSSAGNSAWSHIQGSHKTQADRNKGLITHIYILMFLTCDIPEVKLFTYWEHLNFSQAAPSTEIRVDKVYSRCLPLKTRPSN